MTTPRLHPRTIEAVKEHADIVDVVGEHVVLKKRGKEFVGVCPFHDDTKPSMTVSPEKQFYYCFSCGAGGNSIKFLMEFQRLSFGEVVLELARKYQLDVETLDGPQQERLKQQLSLRDSLYKILKFSSSWFEKQLNSSMGTIAYKYLIDERKLNTSCLQEFQLGYSPGSWDGLLNYLHLENGFSLKLIEEAGLIVPRKSGNGFYDRFRNRLMVPINDRQGRVIGFGGRSLDGSEPKYLNSPETRIFDKGKTLFGLDKASKFIRQEDRAIVVEGYFDVIALHSVGINNVVASLGTALNKQQITQLCRCTDNKRIILNFDTDNAGIRAANRAIGEVEQLAMQGQVQLRILQLPSGKDPDEFLKNNGAPEYRVLVDKSPLWLDWQIEQTFQNLDLTKADHFQLAVSGLVELLGKLPQSAIRTHYLQRVSERLSGGHSRLALQLEEDLRKQVKGQRWHGRSSRYEKPGEATQRERREAEILCLYLNSSLYRMAVRKELRTKDLEDFAIHHHRLIWAAINEVEESELGIDIMEAFSLGKDLSDQLSKVELPRLLSDYLTLNNSELVSRLIPLLEPSEVQIVAMNQPMLFLRGATAVLERQKSLKRCRHLLDAWSGQRLQTLERCISSLIDEERTYPQKYFDMEKRIEQMFNELNSDALRFQELYYSERKHIIYLDQQRCSGYQNEEIASN